MGADGVVGEVERIGHFFDGFCGAAQEADDPAAGAAEESRAESGFLHDPQVTRIKLESQ
jgi:hypothetical protein